MAVIYENTQPTISGSTNEAIAPENSSQLSQHETQREELEAIVEESAVEYAECEVPAEALEVYTVECSEFEVPAEALEEYTVEYTVYEVLSSSEEAAADAVCEGWPECENRAPFSLDDYGYGYPWDAADPRKEPTSAPAEESASVPYEKSASTSIHYEITASPPAEKPTSVFCEETATAPAAIEEPTSVSDGKPASAPAEVPASVAYTEPISIYSKEPTSIAHAGLAPLLNAEPTAVPDKELVPFTKVSRKGMILGNGKEMYVIINAHSSKAIGFPNVFSALPKNEQSQIGMNKKKGER